VWATWCPSCKVEHPVPEPAGRAGRGDLRRQLQGRQRRRAKWLAEFHNPYQLDIRDEQGSLGLDLGVYGAPETFLIDAKGIIRYKHVGVSMPRSGANSWRRCTRAWSMRPSHEALAGRCGAGLEPGRRGQGGHRHLPVPRRGRARALPQLTKELRCPKCQNQDIADSNAPIAADLRREIFRMLGEGKSNQQIIDFMVDRYGDFVRYKPALSGAPGCSGSARASCWPVVSWCWR
jgi:hypothetical protein